VIERNTLKLFDNEAGSGRVLELKYTGFEYRETEIEKRTGS